MATVSNHADDAAIALKEMYDLYGIAEYTIDCEPGIARPQKYWS